VSVCLFLFISFESFRCSYVVLLRVWVLSYQVNDVPVVKCPLTPSFEVDESALQAAITPDTKIIFLCSPGNPTAKSIPLEVRVREKWGGGRTLAPVLSELWPFSSIYEVNFVHIELHPHMSPPPSPGHRARGSRL